MLFGEVVELFRNEPFLEKVWLPVCDTIPRKTWTNVSLPERIDRKTVANQKNNTTKVKLGEPIYLLGVTNRIISGKMLPGSQKTGRYPYNTQHEG